MTLKVNERVERLDGGYTKGKQGKVVEIQLKGQPGNGYQSCPNDRARVFWDGDKRTWVKFSSLKQITQKDA